MKKKFSLLLILCTILTSVNAQNTLNFVNVGKNINDFPIYINSAFQDTKGRVWMGTSFGLYSFDGGKVTRQKDTLDNFEIGITYAGPINDDSIIVSTDKALGLFTNHHFVSTDFPKAVTGIYKTNSNTQYLTTAEGLYIWRHSKPVLVEPTKGMSITSATVSKQGVLYFLSSQGIYSYANNQLTLLTKSIIKNGTIFCTSNNTLLYADTILYKLSNNSSEEIVRFKNSVTAIFESPKQEIMVCALSLFKMSNKIIDTIFNASASTNDFIKTGFYDKAGTLWLLGEYNLYRESFNIYTLIKTDYIRYLYYEKPSDSLQRFLYISNQETVDINGKKNKLDHGTGPEPIIYDFQFIGNNEFYCATSYGYEYHNNNRVLRVPIPNSRGSTRIFQVSGRNQTWMHTTAGPVLLNKDTYHIYNSSTGTNLGPKTGIGSILPDPLYNWVWVGGYKGEFGYLDVETNKYYFFDSLLKRGNISTEKNRILSMVCDKENNLWVAILNKGIFKITRNSKDPKLLISRFWDETAVTTCHFDRNGNLWAMGLNTIKIYAAGAAGVPEDPFLCKVINPTKDLEGVTDYNYFFKPSKYNPPGHQFIYSISKPLLYDFNLAGLFPKISLKNPVTFNAVYLNRENAGWEKLGYATDISGTPILPKFAYKHNNIGFNFSTISAATENVTYRYRLTASEEEWHNTTITSIHYNNLTAGKYSFDVQYSVDGINWSGTYSYNFTILTPWWDTWLFRVALLSLLLIIIILVIKIKTASLKKSNQKLEAKIQKRTQQLENSISSLETANKQNELFLSVLAHDIKGPMRFMGDVTENLHDNWYSLKDNDKVEFSFEIKKASKVLLTFITNFLSWATLRKEKKVETIRVSVCPLFEKIVNYQQATQQVII